MSAAGDRVRANLPKELQVKIFRRDQWLCHWCRRTVIFGPVMKCLQMELKNAGFIDDLAYYHAHWTRRNAPLIDELGAVLDHVEAFASGGRCSEDNLVTSCARCNGRKSSAALDTWEKREKRRPVKGKCGEPESWDGLSSVFLMFALKNQQQLSPTERAWLKALQDTNVPKQHGVKCAE
jgi:5-methylcytosine-specific restriction endonuclease McrA